MKTQIKSIISFVVVLFASITANAAGSLYIDDFSISPGDTKQVAINFESDTDLAGIQAIVTLPSGLDFVDLRTENDIIDEQDPYYFVMSERANGHEVSGAFQDSDNKVYKIMIQSTNNFVDAATAGTSAIAYFKVQASADFSGQSNYIKLTDVYASNSSGETSTKLSDTVATVSEVVVLVESVTLDKSTLSLFVGKTATLTATVLPSEAANKNITWSSTNSNIASVNASGLVTAKAAGTVTIRATAQDGSGKSASCTVTVTAPSNKFYINNFSIAAGEEKEVAILLDNNVNFTAFQAELTLPKGLEFVNIGTEESPVYFTLSDRANGHSISSAIIDSNPLSRKIISYSTGNKNYSSVTTSGIKELVYFKVKAADNFRLSHTIKLNNINFETKSEETYKLDASTATVIGPEVYEPTGVEFVVTSPLNGTLTFYVDSGEVQPILVTPKNGYSLHSLTFNGEDVTGEVYENMYVTPTITEASTLYVAFEIATGVEEVINSDRVKVTAFAGWINVNGTIPGELVNVYTTDGVLVKSAVSEGDLLEFEAENGVVYIVKTNNHIVKVMM